MSHFHATADSYSPNSSPVRDPTPSLHQHSSGHFDEHLVPLEELERRFRTNRTVGLSTEQATRFQMANPELNLLPTDLQIGHGSIHELVAVLRDGSWIHTRAENLLRGDIIVLKEAQCVPADVRIIECFEDLWVDQSVLFGKREPELRVAINSSVFDSTTASVPYMEATNLAFYGTTIVRGHAKAMVIRTGQDTVLGKISLALVNHKREQTKLADILLSEELQQFDLHCKNDHLPTATSRISAFVVEHRDILKRTIVSASFGARPPIVVRVEDVFLANLAKSEDIEREIAMQMKSQFAKNQDAQAFMHALAACEHRVMEMSMSGTSTSSSTNGPCREHDNDRIRDQNSILRFAGQFGAISPQQATSFAHRRVRFSSLLHGEISGCEVYVHFDDQCGSHVVLLQGPSREILSRCSLVHQDSTMTRLDTEELTQIQQMVHRLEAQGETVISFAELYLDPMLYPVGVKFDIENFNFPTSNMCYLGSLGLVEKLHPDILAMASHAQEADVRLLITSTDTQFQAPSRRGSMTNSRDATVSLARDDEQEEEDSEQRLQAICQLQLRVRELASDNALDIDTNVYRSDAISVSNTLTQWKSILCEQPLVVFDGCSPVKVELLVETLQELGETVALVASGSANALALSNADVGFAMPTDEIVDLGEEAADVVLGQRSISPRCDALRIVQTVKKVPGVGELQNNGDLKVALQQEAKSRTAISSIFREAIVTAKLMGLSDADIKSCFEVGFEAATGSKYGLDSHHATTNPLQAPASPPRIISYPSGTNSNTAAASIGGAQHMAPAPRRSINASEALL